MTGAPELRAALRRGASALRREALLGAIKEIAVRATLQARWSIGRENAWWAPLARRTVQEKRRLGYTGHVSATDPLLRTGRMRTSIRAGAVGLTAFVFSRDDVALWQDQGTHTIPARHFLLPAMETAVEAGIPVIRIAWDSVWE